MWWHEQAASLVSRVKEGKRVSGVHYFRIDGRRLMGSLAAYQSVL